MYLLITVGSVFLGKKIETPGLQARHGEGRHGAGAGSRSRSALAGHGAHRHRRVRRAGHVRAGDGVPDRRSSSTTSSTGSTCRPSGRCRAEHATATATRDRPPCTRQHGTSQAPMTRPRLRAVLRPVQAAHRARDRLHRARGRSRSRPGRRCRGVADRAARAGGDAGLGRGRRVQPVRRARPRRAHGAHAPPRVRHRPAHRRARAGSRPIGADAGARRRRAGRASRSTRWPRSTRSSARSSTASSTRSWLKRRTWLNIVIGGLAGSFAVLAGAAAVDAGRARRRCRSRSPWCCSCGRRRISGASRSPSATTTRPPACRCCRWSSATPAPRARCSPAPRARRRVARPARSSAWAGSTLAGAVGGGALLPADAARGSRSRRTARAARWSVSTPRSIQLSLLLVARDRGRGAACAEPAPRHRSPTALLLAAARRPRRCPRSPAAVRAGAAAPARRSTRARRSRRSQRAIGTPVGDYALTDGDGTPRAARRSTAASRCSCRSSTPAARRSARRRRNSSAAPSREARARARRRTLSTSSPSASTCRSTRPTAMREFARTAGHRPPRLGLPRRRRRRRSTPSRATWASLRCRPPRGFDHLTQVTIVDARRPRVPRRSTARSSSCRCSSAPLKELVTGAPAPGARPRRPRSSACASCAPSTIRARGKYRLNYGAVHRDLRGPRRSSVATLGYLTARMATARPTADASRPDLARTPQRVPLHRSWPAHACSASAWQTTRRAARPAPC